MTKKDVGSFDLFIYLIKISASLERCTAGTEEKFNFLFYYFYTQVEERVKVNL